MPVIFEICNSRYEPRPVPGLRNYLWLTPLRLKPIGDGPVRMRHKSHLILCAGRVRQWLLVVSDAQRLVHNGLPVFNAGPRVLAHRDALAVEGHAPVFFSTEEPARIEPFDGATATCPRCRDELLPDLPAVRCPKCGVSHHEMPDRNCWTYASTCALCVQPTPLDTGLLWTPTLL